MAGEALMILAIQVVMAAVYLLLGQVIYVRRPGGDARLAATAFAAWWLGLGIFQAMAIGNALVTATIGWSFAAYMAYLHALLLELTLILAALTYYFVYIFTGRRNSWIWVAAGYVFFYAFLLYYVALADPAGLVIEDGSTNVDYANDLEGSALATALGLLLIGPPLIGAIGYLSLYFKAPGRSQRFRIGAIGGAFLVWFGSSLLVSNLTDLAGTITWRVLSSMIALGASFLVYVAFRPPAWLRDRFHIYGFGEAASDD